MTKIRIAVPSMEPGGLESQRSGHFGRCDMFTLVDVEDNKIQEVNMLANVEHTEGGCMVPVNLLANNDVSLIVVGGMGLRPLIGFKEMGIDVLIGQGLTVRDAVNGYLHNKLEKMTEDFVCGG